MQCTVQIPVLLCADTIRFAFSAMFVMCVDAIICCVRSRAKASAEKLHFALFCLRSFLTQSRFRTTYSKVISIYAIVGLYSYTKVKAIYSKFGVTVHTPEQRTRERYHS